MDDYGQRISTQIDWFTVGLYVVLVILGWLNIYAAVYDMDSPRPIFDFSLNSGRQLVFIAVSFAVAWFLVVSDVRLITNFSYISYGLGILLLVAVLIFGGVVSGSRSWFEIGVFKFQPAELAKYVTALALARFLAYPHLKMNKIADISLALLFLIVPVVLILMQGDTGSAMVFVGFSAMLYREGMSGKIMLAGIFCTALLIVTVIMNDFKTELLNHILNAGAMLMFLGLLYGIRYERGDYKKGWLQILLEVLAILAVSAAAYLLEDAYQLWAILGALLLALVLYSIFKRKVKLVVVIFSLTAFTYLAANSLHYFINDILRDYQRERLMVLVNPEIDPAGIGWQVKQSKVAIGAGGIWGRGYLEGTQTKFKFVPDQSTDFIFCTIGEEHGWVGSFFLVAAYVTLLCRLVVLAERQKARLARVYGYCTVGIFFFHFIVNLGMTIGYLPVIGIPLPFFSYGGSALVSFTLLLFTMIKFDIHRQQEVLLND